MKRYFWITKTCISHILALKNYILKLYIFSIKIFNLNYKSSVFLKNKKNQVYLLKKRQFKVKSIRSHYV